MNALVVGGTKGLGFELAKFLKDSHDRVIVTGRSGLITKEVDFVQLNFRADIESGNLLDSIVERGSYRTVVYNPGFYQEGRIDELADEQIMDMITVGFLGASYLMQRIMRAQRRLEQFIAVTSTSQWTPRELEPVYTGVKAALGMFANSLSLDPRIQKTLVVGPSGMKTDFWKGTNKDTSGMLEPAWVAEKIVELLEGNFKYKYARILRGPERVEIVETR
jgi:NAD(P)-dependent dehydrogenase (short-subunit alcohol dehydrogenase family)